MKKRLDRIIKGGLIIAGISFVGLGIAAIIKKSSSVYSDEPKQKNPMEGKKVLFISSREDAPNADGEKGHLVAYGEASYTPGFYEKYIKRFLDIVISGAGLLILSPLFAGVALAIYIDDPGPVVDCILGEEKSLKAA